MNKLLEELYEASAEDVAFGLGAFEILLGIPLPTVCIAYRQWSTEMLRIIRESFTDGLVLRMDKQEDGTHVLSLATRQTMHIELSDDRETDVLRAPAWHASLEHLEDAAAKSFEHSRESAGGVLLILTTPQEAFGCWINSGSSRVILGPIAPLNSLGVAVPPIG